MIESSQESRVREIRTSGLTRGSGGFGTTKVETPPVTLYSTNRVSMPTYSRIGAASIPKPDFDPDIDIMLNRVPFRLSSIRKILTHIDFGLA